MDFIFTVCDNAAGEVCPVWPGKPMTAHWGVADPAAAQGTDVEKAAAFRKAFKELEIRVKLFTILPIGSLDNMTRRRLLRTATVPRFAIASIIKTTRIIPPNTLISLRRA